MLCTRPDASAFIMLIYPTFNRQNNGICSFKLKESPPGAFATVAGVMFFFLNSSGTADKSSAIFFVLWYIEYTGKRLITACLNILPDMLQYFQFCHDNSREIGMVIDMAMLFYLRNRPAAKQAQRLAYCHYVHIH